MTAWLILTRLKSLPVKSFSQARGFCHRCYSNADHTQWIDGTPFLIAALMCFIIMRFLGLGFNNTSLYVLGGIMTVAVGIVRIMIYSLPKQGRRLGQ